MTNELTVAYCVACWNALLRDDDEHRCTTSECPLYEQE